MFLAYYCDTQKQSSGEFAKCVGKQLCRSYFLNKVAGLKKRLQLCFSRTLLEDCSKISFLASLLTVFYKHSKNNCTFRERFIFQIFGLFLLFMSGFYTMEPKQVDEPSIKTKERYQVFIQHITKIIIL